MIYDTKFTTKQELYEWIKTTPNGYHRVLKSFKIWDEVGKLYTGTKNMGENFWLFCHDYEHPLTCKCGAKLLFENIISGYKSRECKLCYNKNRKENGVIETKKREEADKPLPKCQNILCNNPVILNNTGLHSVYCSKKCRGIYNSLSSRSKSKKTMLANHGVEHALQSDVIYQAMLDTNKEKYGVENVMCKPEIALLPVATKLEKYGCKSSWSENYQGHVDKSAERFGYESGVFTNVSQIPAILGLRSAGLGSAHNVIPKRAYQKATNSSLFCGRKISFILINISNGRYSYGSTNKGPKRAGSIRSIEPDL